MGFAAHPFLLRGTAYNRPVDGLLIEGRVLTMDASRPTATAVLARDGRIVALDAEARTAAGAGVRRLSLRPGQVLLPAFIDPHVHILGSAARKLAVDCGPEHVRSIDELIQALRERANATPAGEWVRAAGYDETMLAERRHPTRHDLDRATTRHPVRLAHRTGHASVLNTLALRLTGIDRFTEEPPGGFMDRDLSDGEPNGLLIEMEDVVARAIPPLPYAELRGAVARFDRELLATGVTWVEDATADNGPDEWRLLERLLTDGALHVGVSMMESVDRIGTSPSSAAGGRLRRSGVKVAPRELEDEVYPGVEGLASVLRRAVEAGKQTAVHAVGRRGVETAIEAYAPLAPLATTMRIEHAGVCGQESARRIATLGLAVVTQPGSVYWHGDAYLRRVRPEDQPDLYPLRRLIDAGVLVAGSSDSPVSPPDVLVSLRAATQRRTRSGQLVAPEHALTIDQALALHTVNAARVLGLERERGMVRPGLAADFVVLSADPTHPAVDMAKLRVEATIIAGQTAYELAAGVTRPV